MGFNNFFYFKGLVYTNRIFEKFPPDFIALLENIKDKANLDYDELFTLFRFDDDPFTRWNSGQHLMRMALIARASGSPNIQLESSLINILSELIES